MHINCEHCKGSGKVDAKEGKPWTEVTAKPNPEVRAGRLLAANCPKCQGFGYVESDDAPTKAAPPTAKK